MGVGLMATRPRLLNAVRPDRRAVPPCTCREEVLLIAGSTVASASRPSSISSTAWGFSPSELTPKSHHKHVTRQLQTLFLKHSENTQQSTGQTRNTYLLTE